MAKRIKETEATVEQVTEVTKEVTLPTDKAYSITFNESTKYSVVEVSFDVSTNTTVSPKVLGSNLDYYDAIDLFKTSVVKAGLFDKKISNL